MEAFQKHEIRKCISNFSAQAYNKGKKKLIVENDYNEYLGLKNIYHAFQFITDAKWYFHDGNLMCDMAFRKDFEIWELYDIRNKIFTTYQNSTGTLEERWKVLDSVMKPLYNAYMTDFRKLFPKEIV